MRVAIHHNAWHICGGGELYIGAMAEELSTRHEVSLIVTTPFDPARLGNLLGLHFDHVRIEKLEPLSDPGLSSSRWQRFLVERSVTRAMREFDVGIRVATGRVPFGGARRNLLHVQVPYSPGRSLSTIWQSFSNRRALRSYERIVYNSRFTASMASGFSLPSQKTTVLYPPVEMGTAPPCSWKAREPVVLAVGRFTDQNHPKRQLELVRAFKQLLDEGLRGWSLVLAGSVGRDSASRNYLESVRAAAKGLPVELRVDISRQELIDLYERSRLFWHATGMDLDEWTTPHKVEHFGITTVEAMARGCIGIVVDLGGQREIVQHEVNGFRWANEAELRALTWRVIRGSQSNDAMIERGVESARKFSRERFAREAHALVSPLEDPSGNGDWTRLFLCPACRCNLTAQGAGELSCPECKSRWRGRGGRVPCSGTPSCDASSENRRAMEGLRPLGAGGLARTLSSLLSRRRGGLVLHVGARATIADLPHHGLVGAVREPLGKEDPPRAYQSVVELGGFQQLPFATATFDAVLLEPAGVSAAEATRVLRVGGLLLVPQTLETPIPPELSSGYRHRGTTSYWKLPIEDP